MLEFRIVLPNRTHFLLKVDLFRRPILKNLRIDGTRKIFGWTQERCYDMKNQIDIQTYKVLSQTFVTQLNEKMEDRWGTNDSKILY